MYSPRLPFCRHPRNQLVYIEIRRGIVRQTEVLYVQSLFLVHGNVASCPVEKWVGSVGSLVSRWYSCQWPAQKCCKVTGDVPVGCLRTISEGLPSLNELFAFSPIGPFSRWGDYDLIRS